MRKYTDLTGQRFGRLVVIDRAPTKVRNGRSKTSWICQCDCGNKTAVLSENLKSGNTKSCGCLHKERVSRKAGAAE